MKLLTNNNGEIEEVAPITQSTGSSDASKAVQTDASGKLDASLLPTGIGADVVAIQASEALAAGDLVNIYNNAGTPAVRKAIATGAGTKAHGYVIAGAASGALANVYFDDSNNQVSGLTAGEQYLSATQAGKTVAVAPAAAGQLAQKVGVATSATTLHVSIGPAIKLA